MAAAWGGVAAVLAVIGASGCTNGLAAPVRIVPGGSPDLGRKAIRHYGCGSCHEIPGVRAANGLVGPPLIKWSRRGFIAGELQNTPDNLQRWILNPKAVEPGTDMPNLHVTQADARNIAAYLYTIK
ncbi:MAG: c-type cytochrome [Actinobacteria bacterium]|nr:c-type cytochrome [Actinomycetota bacterium]